MYKSLLTLTLLLTSAIVIAQSPATGKRRGHEYVDLGLSVKWATCNIGANQTSDYGDYFAWGEAKTKSAYTESNSTTYEKATYTFLDAASINWGSGWRIPTKAECQELIDNCFWKWTTVDGHTGYIVTSNKNGNSIFLPAVGIRVNYQLHGADDYGMYWSSQPFEVQYIGNEPIGRSGAYSLTISSSDPEVSYCARDRGVAIRPVTK